MHVSTHNADYSQSKHITEGSYVSVMSEADAPIIQIGMPPRLSSTALKSQ